MKKIIELLNTKTAAYIISIIILTIFAFFFAYDILFLKSYFSHPDFRLYYAYREWFSQELIQGHFPLWNPYWGLGLPAIEWATIPVDIYTFLEIIFGYKYQYYQVLQVAFILLICFYVFVKLGFKPIQSVAGSILFFMTPWVTYFYFYFFTVNFYVANALLFLFVYLWFKTENSKYLFFIAFVTVFSLFGTKFEYWFYQTVFYTFLPICAGIIFHSEDKLKTVKNSVLPVFFMYAGLLCQFWQINIATKVLKLSGRVDEAGFSNLFSLEMYKNLFMSVSHSFLWNLILFGLLIYWASKHKRNLLWKFLISALTLNWIFKGKLIITFILFTQSPIFIGLLLALLFTLSINRDYDWKNHLKTFLLFLLLVFYWCRPGRGDLGELEILHRAPALFQVLLSFLFWFGCKQFWKNKLTKIAYFSAIFIFLMRNQGQIILAYLTGLLWIPTRDNYIIDFAMVIIALTGMQALTVQNAVIEHKRRFNSKILLKLIPIFTILIIVFSYAGNFYYSHTLMIKSENTHPSYTDVNKMRKVIKELQKNTAFPRVLFLFDKWPNLGFNYGYASSLLEKTSQVQLYDSLIPKNYKDWCIYKNTGIRPEENWSDYPNEYTQETISTLPHKNTYGHTQISTYISTILAVPPFEKNTIKSLGVNYLITMLPPDIKFSENTIKEFDLDNIKEKKDITFPETNKHIYTAHIKNSLPRAFLLHIPEKVMGKYKEEMDLIVNKNSILLGKFDYPIIPAAIEKDEAEKIFIKTTSKKDNYLLLLDLYHPFWHAKIDGKKTQIVQAFSIFRAVKIPQGNHKIEFYYAIPYFKESIIISFLTLLMLIIAGTR